MVFAVVGINKEEVEKRIGYILSYLETQGKFDFTLDMRQHASGWIAALQIYFHMEKYTWKH